MKIGPIFLIPTPDLSVPFEKRYAQVFEKVEYANGRGYEAVWFTEHHFSDYGISPNPLMFLGHAAHVAPDLRLGTAVITIPMWHPLRWAEDVAILDNLTGGRMDVGIGRGYPEYEFEAFGHKLADNREMFEESLAIALKAWTGEELEHHGHFWTIPRVTVFPTPVQSPHPPLWMAATSPESIRSAVEHGFHPCVGTGAVFDELVQRNAFIDSILDELGRPHDQIERAANRFIFCSTSQADTDAAIEAARWQVRVSQGLRGGLAPPRGRNSAPPWPGEPEPAIWQERMIIGDPDECITRIEKLAEAGISYIYAIFEMGGLDIDLTMRSMKLFTEEVVPALRSIEPVRQRGSDRETLATDFLTGNGPRYVGI